MKTVTRTLTIKLNVSVSDAMVLMHTAMAFSDACIFVSKYAFEHDLCLNSRALHEAMYYDVRNRFGLKAQMAASVIRTVTAKYKTVDTQLKNGSPYIVNVEGMTHAFRKDISWLQKPVVFHHLNYALVHGRDYSFLNDGKTLSFNTLNGRIKVNNAPILHSYIKSGKKFGGAYIYFKDGNWFFAVSYDQKVDDACIVPESTFVGIDRGIRYTGTCYDGKKTSFINGKPLAHRRAVYQETRAKLQAKGTKSAKRVLKRISGRENRWMSDINHQISKTLVSIYQNDTLFVLEDLTGVSFDEITHGNKEHNNTLRSWSFYDLEQKLRYKAVLAGSEVLKVPAEYTSQRCPVCWTIDKEARNKETHTYTCKCCGYSTNDDRVGAINLYQLGKDYIHGDKHPRIRKKA